MNGYLHNLIARNLAGVESLRPRGVSLFEPPPRRGPLYAPFEPNQGAVEDDPGRSGEPKPDIGPGSAMLANRDPESGHQLRLRSSGVHHSEGASQSPLLSPHQRAVASHPDTGPTRLPSPLEPVTAAERTPSFSISKPPFDGRSSRDHHPRASETPPLLRPAEEPPDSSGPDSERTVPNATQRANSPVDGPAGASVGGGNDARKSRTGLGFGHRAEPLESAERRIYSRATALLRDALPAPATKPGPANTVTETVAKERIVRSDAPQAAPLDRQLTHGILLPVRPSTFRRDEPGRKPHPETPAGGASAPTIHVSIGRVEVRAMPAPARPTRQRRQPPPVMNLEEYLERLAPGRKR